MRNVPAPRSCAAAALPASTHLFFPLIAPTIFLFAWPDPADAKRMVGEEAYSSKTSYNSGCNKPAPAAKDSSALAQQAAPKAPSRFGGLGGMLGDRPMVDEGNFFERARLDELARQMKLDPPFIMKRERQARRARV